MSSYEKAAELERMEKAKAPIGIDAKLELINRLVSAVELRTRYLMVRETIGYDVSLTDTILLSENIFEQNETIETIKLELLKR